MQFACTVMAAVWAFKIPGPAVGIQRRSALLLGPVVFQKLCQTQPRLELDHVLHHGSSRLPLFDIVSVSSYLWLTIDGNQFKICPFWGYHNLFSGTLLAKEVCVGFPISILSSGSIRGLKPTKVFTLEFRLLFLCRRLVQRLPHKAHHFPGAGHFDFIGMFTRQ